MNKCVAEIKTKHSSYIGELWLNQVQQMRKSCEVFNYKFKILYWIGGNDESNKED